MASKFEKYKDLGDKELEKGNYQEGLVYFERAIRAEPKNPDGWTRKAAAEIYLRQYLQAIKASDEALNLDRRHADAWFNRGLALDKRRNYDEALKNYDYALKYKPRHIKALNNKGTVLGQLERWSEAKQCFEQVLRYDPKNKDAKENLSLLSDYQAGKHKSRCFIATAAYGSYLAPELKYLRNFRDNNLEGSILGDKIVRLYYLLSPEIAEIISRYEFLKKITRWVIHPLIIILMNRR